MELRWTFRVESFVGLFVIELLEKGIELGLLLQQVGAGGTSGVLLQRQMHVFMAAQGMTGLNAFDADS